MRPKRALLERRPGESDEQFFARYVPASAEFEEFPHNDIAIIWPPQRQPLLVTAYYAGSNADTEERHAVLAAVGRIAASI